MLEGRQIGGNNSSTHRRRRMTAKVECWIRCSRIIADKREDHGEARWEAKRRKVVVEAQRDVILCGEKGEETTGKNRDQRRREHSYAFRDAFSCDYYLFVCCFAIFIKKGRYKWENRMKVERCRSWEYERGLVSQSCKSSQTTYTGTHHDGSLAFSLLPALVVVVDVVANDRSYYILKDTTTLTAWSVREAHKKNDVCM